MRFIRWSGATTLAAVLMGSNTVAGDHVIQDIPITASRYAFEPATIQVNAGEPVRIVIRSKDGVHGFSIPKLKIDVQVPNGGAPVTMDFTAPPEGRYEIVCSELCGFGHGQMKAALVSIGPVQTSR
jgi:cytochrome c oxidase subunit 2